MNVFLIGLACLGGVAAFTFLFAFIAGYRDGRRRTKEVMENLKKAENELPPLDTVFQKMCDGTYDTEKGDPYIGDYMPGNRATEDGSLR